MKFLDDQLSIAKPSAQPRTVIPSKISTKTVEAVDILSMYSTDNVLRLAFETSLKMIITHFSGVMSL